MKLIRSVLAIFIFPFSSNALAAEMIAFERYNCDLPGMSLTGPLHLGRVIEVVTDLEDAPIADLSISKSELVTTDAEKFVGKIEGDGWLDWKRNFIFQIRAEKGKMTQIIRATEREISYLRTRVFHASEVHVTIGGCHQSLERIEW